MLSTNSTRMLTWHTESPILWQFCQNFFYHLISHFLLLLFAGYTSRMLTYFRRKATIWYAILGSIYQVEVLDLRWDKMYCNEYYFLKTWQKKKIHAKQFRVIPQYLWHKLQKIKMAVKTRLQLHFLDLLKAGVYEIILFWCHRNDFRV